MMHVNEFLERVDKALNSKTLYVSGCFGAPMSEELGPTQGKFRYLNNNYVNQQEPNHTWILNATFDTFGFDCVNLIKGCVWEWDGDVTRVYGGAGYKINGLEECNANSILTRYGYDVSSDFSKIVPGEIVWMQDHVGVYVGNGYVVEATSRWEHKVLKSVCLNVMDTADIHRRKWSRHGKLKCLDYGEAKTPVIVEPVAKPVESDIVKYKVVKGDNLTKIAAKYNTTVDKIVERNKPTHAKMTRNFICVGWVLEIKVGEK